MSDLNEAFLKQKEKEITDQLKNRPIYLVVEKTISRKVHPKEIYGYSYDPEEAFGFATTCVGLEMEVLPILPLSVTQVAPKEKELTKASCL